jgi:predicted hotdog family 3-hydroxylacyl-ACP dehydratase
MMLNDIRVEDLIPHRDRMKLVDKILTVDDTTAVTESVVSEKWPAAGTGGACALTLVELVAQTAGVCIGWRELQKHGDTKGGRGWLVGIKQAVFMKDPIPFGAKIITSTQKKFSFEGLSEITGTVRIGKKSIADVILQVVHEEV